MGPDYLNHRLVVSKTMAGYLAGKRGGRPRPFALFMNNGFFPFNPDQIFVASRDLAHIAAQMQLHEPK